MNKNKNINSYRNFGFIVLGSWWQLGQKRNFLFKSNSKSTLKVEEILKGGLDLIPSPSPFSENSNYGWESLFKV